MAKAKKPASEDTRERCKACAGIGVEEVDDRIKSCPECNGSGREGDLK